jgi:hypothetical protein
MTFIVFNMVFLVAFPSLVSAMSGYDTNNAAFVKDPDSENETWVDFGTYKTVQAIIHDGWRIGLEGNHLIDYSPYGGNKHILQPRSMGYYLTTIHRQ